jgi:hypothetical protein
VRAGEERDLAAIVAMGRARAGRLRFHLDRDVDFVQYAITTRRWLAGLGSADARQLHFLIAEEGMTAAAYVIISIVVGNRWTLEECGDRDPSGAGVGALLQALLARSPEQRRPTIRAWLPPGFCLRSWRSFQLTSKDVVSVRIWAAPTGAPLLSDDDVLAKRHPLNRPSAGRISPDLSSLAPSASSAMAVSSSVTHSRRARCIRRPAKAARPPAPLWDVLVA